MIYSIILRLLLRHLNILKNGIYYKYRIIIVSWDLYRDTYRIVAIFVCLALLLSTRLVRCLDFHFRMAKWIQVPVYKCDAFAFFCQHTYIWKDKCTKFMSGCHISFSKRNQPISAIYQVSNLIYLGWWSGPVIQCVTVGSGNGLRHVI